MGPFKFAIKYFVSPFAFCYCMVLLFSQIRVESGLATSITLAILSFAVIVNLILTTFAIHATKLVLDQGIDLAKSLSEVLKLASDASDTFKSDVAKFLKEIDEDRARGSNWTPPNKNRVN